MKEVTGPAILSFCVAVLLGGSFQSMGIAPLIVLPFRGYAHFCVIGGVGFLLVSLYISVSSYTTKLLIIQAIFFLTNK